VEENKKHERAGAGESMQANKVFRGVLNAVLTHIKTSAEHTGQPVASGTAEHKKKAQANIEPGSAKERQKVKASGTSDFQSVRFDAHPFVVTDGLMMRALVKQQKGSSYDKPAQEKMGATGKAVSQQRTRSMWVLTLLRARAHAYT